MKIKLPFFISTTIIFALFTFFGVIQFFYFDSAIQQVDAYIQNNSIENEHYGMIKSYLEHSLVRVLILLCVVALVFALIVYSYNKWIISPIHIMTDALQKNQSIPTNKFSKITSVEEIENFSQILITHMENQTNKLEEKKGQYQKVVEKYQKLYSDNNEATVTISNLLSKENQYKRNIKKLEYEKEKKIEEKRKSELEKEKAISLAKRKTEFLTNMSHEIRTPLNAIVGLSQILLEETKGKSLPKEFVRHISTIKIAGSNLAELINNLLDLSKMEAGKSTLNFENVQFTQLITSIYHINKPKAQIKNLVYTYFIHENVPEHLFIDRTKINQVLMNFVSNAIKFTPKGKKVHINAKIEGKHLLLEVRDTGIGISQDAQEKIFKPFEQSHNRITSHYGGTGLGLSITKAIAEQLNGKVWVQSILDDGSSFFFKIPLMKKTQPDEKRTKEEDIFKTRYLKDQKVLLVEDDRANLEMITFFLDKIDLSYATAMNGKEAIKLLNNENFSLIITDIKMPIMDGVDTLLAIRKNPKNIHIPIFALSAVVEEEETSKIKALGFNEYIIKPVQMDTLIAKLSKYLVKRGSINIDKDLKEKLRLLITLHSFDFPKVEATLSLIQASKKIDGPIDTQLEKVAKGIRDKDMLTIVHAFKAIEKFI